MEFTCDNPQYQAYEIGRFTYGEPLIHEWGEGATLKIGSFCSLAGKITIFLGGNHRPDWITTYPFNVILKEFGHIEGHPSTRGDVVIGNDVWIGEGATILSGVTIGDGAVIGACALVAKAVSPYAIVGGNPVQELRKRFDQPTVDALLRIKWWDWDIEKIKDNIPLMLDTKVSAFVKKHNA